MGRPGSFSPPDRPVVALTELTAVRISVTAEPGFERAVDREWLAGIARIALSVGGVPGDVELAVALVGEETARRLNRDYRGINRPTDVLSFAQLESPAQPFVGPPRRTTHLGDVIICWPRVLAQAAAHGHCVERELAYLLVHGALHLAGFDHDDEREYAGMRRAEEEVLEYLGLGRAAGREELSE